MERGVDESCVCQLLRTNRMLVIEQSDNDNAWVRHSHQIDLTNLPSNVLQWQKPTAQMIHLGTANSIVPFLSLSFITYAALYVYAFIFTRSILSTL